MASQQFDWAFAEAASNLTLAQADAMFEPMIEEIETLKGQYGRLLAATAIGRDVAPIFGAQLDWRELSVKWRKRKGSFPKNRFYQGLTKGRSSLASELFSLPTERLFGRTQLRTRIEQVETAGFYNPRIRRRIDTVFRDDMGRFARSNPEARKRVVIRVNPFPEIGRDESDIIRALPISQKNKKKLDFNAEARPLIGPYTDWFFERKIRGKIIAMAQGIK